VSKAAKATQTAKPKRAAVKKAPRKERSSKPVAPAAEVAAVEVVDQPTAPGPTTQIAEPDSRSLAQSCHRARRQSRARSGPDAQHAVPVVAAVARQGARV
jgi:hypothetical protein